MRALLPRNCKNKIRYNKPTAPFESERKSKPSEKNAAAAATLSAEGMTRDKEINYFGDLRKGEASDTQIGNL